MWISEAVDWWTTSAPLLTHPLPLAVESSSGDGLKFGTFIIPSAVVVAVGAVIQVLRKSRSTDRAKLSEDQQEHMDRLTEERNDALAHAQDAQRAVDHERSLRRSAEDRAQKSLLKVSELERKVDALTNTIQELTDQVKALKDQVATLTATPST